MDTFRIPLHSPGMADRPQDLNFDPGEDRGHRLPVIEVLAEIASSMNSDADTE